MIRPVLVAAAVVAAVAAVGVRVVAVASLTTTTTTTTTTALTMTMMPAVAVAVAHLPWWTGKTRARMVSINTHIPYQHTTTDINTYYTLLTHTVPY